jgi:hypothetical protein
MSGLRHFTQHPDRLKDPHDHARRLASDALVEPLGDLDAAWLEDHLATCRTCATEVEGFAADAALLRELRGAAPAVPRDLGARVSLALDDEMRRALHRRGGSRARPRSAERHRRSGRSAWAGGAIAGVAVAALVAILVLPLGLLPGAAPATLPPAARPLPAATPITVDTEPVAWVQRTNDGRYVISSAEVDQVCEGADASSCGTLDGGAQAVASLDVKPSSLLLPRDGNPAVVVGNDAVYAVSVNLGEPVTSPIADPSPVPTAEPAQSPAVPGASVTPPADTPAPSVAPASPQPASPVPTEPGPSDAPPASASPEPGPPSPTPEATPELTPEPTPEATPEPATPLPTLPPVTPAPTAEAVLAIAEGVVLVGAPPAYSPDGKWVAFSARPRSGAHGPDVYTWRVGERRARAITDDHGSVFAGWLGDDILASTARLAETAEVDPGDEVPAPDTDPAAVAARSFTIEPSGQAETMIVREGIWRPVVDPTDRLVVFWTGTLGWDREVRAWLPQDGLLVAADWRAVLDPAADLERDPLPATSDGMDTTRFEVRFDPAGRRLGVWVADPEAPGTGHLALIAVGANGSLREVLLSDAAALPGFSLDAERIAWSTPPGRNGVGSHVTVYAWRGELAGQVYSLPDTGDEPIVVAH